MNRMRAPHPLPTNSVRDLRRGLVLLGVIALLAGESAVARPNDPPVSTTRLDIAAHVREAALRFGLPEHWIYAVIRVESGGRTRAVSSAGAMGLMQLMPGTWARQRARLGLGQDPFEPRDNILAGTAYLREMYDLFGAAGFLAAYNAGPGRYLEWRSGRRALPLETRRYVATLLPRLQGGGGSVALNAQFGSNPDPTGPLAVLDAAATSSAARDETRRQPFARQSASAHGLFAPVSASDDR